MIRPRTVLRRLYALLLAGVLLCVQLTALAYACELPAAPSGGTAAQAVLEDCHAAPTDAGGLPDDQAGLCKEHCNADDRMGDPRGKPAASPIDWSPAAVLFELPASPDVATTTHLLVAGPVPWSGTPPLAILLGNFRS